jgi:hypothetical protein
LPTVKGKDEYGVPLLAFEVESFILPVVPAVSFM